MMRFETQLTSSGWQSRGEGIHARGTAFLAGSATPVCLADWLAGKSDPVDADDLRRLNGFFSIIVQQGKKLFAAVDRIRSMPLFYGQTDNVFWISDNCDWVRRKIASREMDPVCREEFLRTGYVTGRETLFPGVYQLQAGEYLTCSKDTRNHLSINTDRYYRFLHVEPENPPNHRSFEREFIQATTAAHERLVGYADGRQIVIPLSGGFDSRLIAAMLRKLNYENVLTFTYGLPGNAEAEISKSVARSLGYEWRFVPYNDKIWRSFFFGRDRTSYNKFAYGGVSLPHPQDWPAIKELKHIGALAPDCVIVPGHSGDFVAGSHIPRFIKPGYKVKQDDLYNSIIVKHYNSLSKNISRHISKYELKIRIEDIVSSLPMNDEFDLADSFEFWDWQERQAKYIVNSVKVYEYFGYDWWLPLWENEFVSFWEKCPLRIRVCLPVYQEMVNRICRSISGYSTKDNYESRFYNGGAADVGMKKKIRDKLILSVKNSEILHPIMKFVKYKRQDIMPNNLFRDRDIFMKFVKGGSLTEIYGKSLLDDVADFG